MAGSNFHKLRFEGGLCIKVDRFGVETYDCTPDWAVPEEENLIEKTVVKNAVKKLERLVDETA